MSWDDTGGWEGAATAAPSGETWQTLDLSGGTDVAGTTYDAAASSWTSTTFTIEGKASTHGRPDAGRDAGGRWGLLGAAFDYSLYDGVLVRLTWNAYEYWDGTAWVAGSSAATDSGFGLALTDVAGLSSKGFYGGFVVIGTDQRAYTQLVGDASQYLTGNPGSGPPGGIDGVEAFFTFGASGVRQVLAGINKRGATDYRGRSTQQEFLNAAMTDLWIGVLCDHNFSHAQTRQRLTGARVQYLLQTVKP